MIAAVDSGLHHVGWSIFDGARLVACGLWRDDVRRPQVLPAPEGIERVTQEVPKIYRGQKKKVRPQDLLNISARGGYVCGLLVRNSELATHKLIAPRDWKGTIDGDAFLDRILGRLGLSERALIKACGCPPYLEHNVIDAVGIGLWEVGRL